MSTPTRETMLAGIRQALEDYGRYGEVRVSTMAELYRISMADWKPAAHEPTLTDADQARLARGESLAEFTEAELDMLNRGTYEPNP